MRTADGCHPSSLLLVEVVHRYVLQSILFFFGGGGHHPCIIGSLDRSQEQRGMVGYLYKYLSSSLSIASEAMCFFGRGFA